MKVEILSRLGRTAPADHQGREGTLQPGSRGPRVDALEQRGLAADSSAGEAAHCNTLLSAGQLWDCVEIRENFGSLTSKFLIKH